MKSLFVFLFAAATLASATAPGAPDAAKGPAFQQKEMTVSREIDSDLVKEAGNRAIGACLDDFVRQPQITLKRFAVLPLETDLEGGYFTAQLRNQFTTKAGAKGCELYTRMDSEWNALLGEIAWGQNYGDTMDPATVQKFGRIQGVQGLILARVSGLDRYGKDDVKLRFIIQVFEVETGRLLWGEEKIAYGRQTGNWMTDLVPEDRSMLLKYVLYGVGGLVGVIVLIVVGGAITRSVRSALKDAARPR